jgi:hypothetical protein
VLLLKPSPKLLLHDRVHRESVTFGGVGRVLTLLLLLLLLLLLKNGPIAVMWAMV